RRCLRDQIRAAARCQDEARARLRRLARDRRSLEIKERRSAAGAGIKGVYRIGAEADEGAAGVLPAAQPEGQGGIRREVWIRDLACPASPVDARESASAELLQVIGVGSVGRISAAADLRLEILDGHREL